MGGEDARQVAYSGIAPFCSWMARIGWTTRAYLGAAPLRLLLRAPRPLLVLQLPLPFLLRAHWMLGVLRDLLGEALWGRDCQGRLADGERLLGLSHIVGAPFFGLEGRAEIDGHVFVGDLRGTYASGTPAAPRDP
jgi:hypothetical protein